ncbi:MAG TPA: RDD family protein [Bryobacteraceae bacterium]|nr:RDD family protein [Bryobacteraceae bacterium]
MFCSKCGESVADGTKFCPSCGSPLGAPGSPAPPSAFTPSPSSPAGPIARAGDYATWSTRAIGYIIDTLLVAPAMLILYFLLSGLIGAFASIGGRDIARGMCCFFIVLFPLATLAVGLYNRVYLIAARGASIGQGVVKVKVVDANGSLLSQGTALIRLLAQAAMGFVPFLPLLDLLWPLWDDHRQTLHDKAVGCYVINNPQAA